MKCNAIANERLGAGRQKPAKFRCCLRTCHFSSGITSRHIPEKPRWRNLSQDHNDSVTQVNNRSRYPSTRPLPESPARIMLFVERRAREGSKHPNKPPVWRITAAKAPWNSSHPSAYAHPHASHRGYASAVGHG